MKNSRIKQEDSNKRFWHSPAFFTSSYSGYKRRICHLIIIRLRSDDEKRWRGQGKGNWSTTENRRWEADPDIVAVSGCLYSRLSWKQARENFHDLAASSRPCRRHRRRKAQPRKAMNPTSLSRPATMATNELRGAPIFSPSPPAPFPLCGIPPTT